MGKKVKTLLTNRKAAYVLPCFEKMPEKKILISKTHLVFYQYFNNKKSYKTMSTFKGCN